VSKVRLDSECFPRQSACHVSDLFLGGFRCLPLPVWAIFIIQIIVRGGDFVFPFLTLFLTRKLGLSPVAAGSWVMGTVIAGLVGTLIAGRLSDRWGRKRVLGICQAGTAVLTVACGFVPPTILVAEVLVAASLFQGAMKPILSAFIMDISPPDRRKDAFALSYLGINIGVAVGPMAAGFLFESHLPWIFFGSGISLGCAFAVLAFLLPRPEPGRHAAASDAERAVEGNALRAFVQRPQLVVFCFIAMLVAFAYGQTTFGLTIYTARLFGPDGASRFGLLMSLNAVVVLVSTAFMTRLTRRLSAPLTMGLGTALYTIGFAMLVFPLGMPLLAVSTVIWTLGEVLLATNFGAYLASQTPWNFRGRFQSYREMLGSTGRILSPVVFGAIIAGAGIHVSWLVTAVTALACTAGFVALHRRARQR
jgi:MFS family permease